MSSDLAAAYHTVLSTIATAGRGRPVRLVAVSKTHPLERIEALAALGQREFGENYVQELVAKQRARPDLTWHQIGPVQSNKAALVARHADWLHTLDRAKLLPLLDRARPAERGRLNVLIQVNIDAEASKSGCRPEEVMPLAAAVTAHPNLQLRGLMAIPTPHPEWTRRRVSFERMVALYAELRTHHPGIDTLSLGMSDDYPLAIECGANLVRIGSALFGLRR